MKNFSTRIGSLSKHALLSAATLALVGMAPLAAQASPDHGNRASHCGNCGTVISTHTYQQKADHGSGVGIATGAVIGGLLGNQVGHGNGRSLATVAGAVGGGYAGNEIEKRSNKKLMTQVRVRMSNGAVRSFTESGASRRHEGQQVRVINGHLG